MNDRAQHIEQLSESFQAIRRTLAAKMSISSDKNLRSITPSQWGVLRIFTTKDHVSIKTIADMLAISSSAATQLVDGLVENGHLKRKDDPDDRRSQYIELSGSAKKQMSLLRKSRLKRLSDVFAALTDKELQQYLLLTRKVTDHLTHS